MTKAKPTSDDNDLTTVGVRLHPATIRRVTAHAERMKKANAWATIRQSDALRDLILLGLAAAEASVEEHQGPPERR